MKVKNNVRKGFYISLIMVIISGAIFMISNEILNESKDIIDIIRPNKEIPIWKNICDIVAIAIFLGGIIVDIVMCRCPHCKKPIYRVLDTKYCPYCSKDIDMNKQ